MSAILVVREADDFSRILAASDYKVINLPLIETKALDDLSVFEKSLAKVENYDGIFLTSVQSTRIFNETLRREKIIYKGKVYVFGKRSYEILKAENLEIEFNETANTAQEFLKEIAPESLRNKRFLFIRGEKSLRVVPEFLSKVAEVDETIVYATREIAVGIDKIKELKEKLARKEIAASCFFSPSGAESFIKQFGAEVLHQTCIATIGKTTAEYFERQSLIADLVSSKSNAEIFAVELIEYLRKDLPAKLTKETKKRAI